MSNKKIFEVISKHSIGDTFIGLSESGDEFEYSLLYFKITKNKLYFGTNYDIEFDYESEVVKQ